MMPNAITANAKNAMVVNMNAAPLMEAYEELRMLLARPETPERVYAACLRLSHFQTKLFCSVSDSYRTWDGAEWVDHAGTLNGGMRLEPSNFLRELLAALRTFEWPRVLILVHDATSTEKNASLYA
jgi:hypothetical protein